MRKKISPQQKAIILYGPPGAGKGTQAELLTRRHRVIHFDTGRYIESIVYGRNALRDPVLRRERNLFDRGILCTPEWVRGIVKDAVRKISQAGYGIIFTGSPRTEFEAFGDKRHKGILDVLTQCYGKKNIITLLLTIPLSASLKRNSNRFICSVCSFSQKVPRKGEGCFFCGGPLRKRSLDDPKIIIVRLKQYKARTYPIIARMKEKKFKVRTVNGSPAPYKVFQAVTRALSL